jgi:sugar transferase (PEP-CTERM/EpsH1 system associated)
LNILYLAHRLPYPPNKGEKIRAFHQIQGLARNHAVHVCALVDDPADFSFVLALGKHCASVEVVCRNGGLALMRGAIGLFMGRPLSVSLFYRKAFALKIEKKLAAARFDCIVCSSSSMAQYAHLATGIPKVIDFIDVDSEKWRVYGQCHTFPMSVIYRLEARRLAKYEKVTAESFDLSILSSEAEERVLKRRMPRDSISVVCNGVDLEYFKASAIGISPASTPSIIFVGVMDYFPNIDAVRYFCREILPLVRDQVPNARFYIVGRSPVYTVKRLADHPNVMVTGAVADVRPYLVRSSVSVAPFRVARGVQNKVLEAMAMGVPVVGTVEAFKGIAATEQDGIRIGDDPLSFARHVIKFLQGDATFRREAGGQARRYVERHHRWENQGARLERLLEDVVRQHREKYDVVSSTVSGAKKIGKLHRGGAEDAEERRV